ncbi:hypothetical protein J6590_055624 [Homalodisca vitripennis]|nr:hypothetical protein J6590_055624 [Homalodisca vitripennis]
MLCQEAVAVSTNTLVLAVLQEHYALSGGYGRSNKHFGDGCVTRALCFVRRLWPFPQTLWCWLCYKSTMLCQEDVAVPKNTLVMAELQGHYALSGGCGRSHKHFDVGCVIRSLCSVTKLLSAVGYEILWTLTIPKAFAGGLNTLMNLADLLDIYFGVSDIVVKQNTESFPCRTRSIPWCPAWPPSLLDWLIRLLSFWS